MIAGDELAQLLDRQLVVEELARHVADECLVLAKSEIPRHGHGVRVFRHRVFPPVRYFDFGRPRTRSPRMLRWTSFVPAAIVCP